MQPNTRDNYFHLKNQKLSKQLAEGTVENVSNIFDGMVFYINGMTDPPPFKLQNLIKIHGGRYCVSRFQSFTHVISSSLSKSSLNSYRNYRVLRPEWIVDCAESRKLIPMDSYLLNSKNDASALSIEKLFQSVSSSRNPSNVEQYFEKSRLHHLSTLKTHFKKICLKNFNQNNLSKKRIKAIKPRMIAHFDMDCFFVAVSIADKPQLNDQPVVVTHANQQNHNSTSSVSSCNYVARRYGISNGMYVKRAYELCPDLVCVPYNFQLIKIVAEKFFKILCDNFALVFPLSCDEALIDVTHELDTETLECKVELVRKLIFESTNCSCSVGCSSSSELCRILLKQAKPNGCRILYPRENDNFIENLEINKLPILDGNSKTILNNFDCKTLKDIKYNSASGIGSIENALGVKLCKKIVRFSKGCFDDDDQNLAQKLTSQRKTVSVNYNFGIRFNEMSQVEQLLESLCGELYSRMIREDVKPILLTLKLMVRKKNAPILPYKRGGHGACDVLSSSSKFLCSVDFITATFLLKKSKEICYRLHFNVEDLRGVSLSLKNTPINSQPDPPANSVIQSFFRPRVGSLNFLHLQKMSTGNSIQDYSQYTINTKTTSSNKASLSLIDLIQNKALNILIRRRFFSNLLSHVNTFAFDQTLINAILDDLDIVVRYEYYSLLFLFLNGLERYKDQLEPNTFAIIKVAINDRIDVYRRSRE